MIVFLGIISFVEIEQKIMDKCSECKRKSNTSNYTGLYDLCYRIKLVPPSENKVIDEFIVEGGFSKIYKATVQ